MKKALIAVLLLACAPLCLAQWTQISATKITDGRAANHLLTSGTMRITGVDSTGAPIPYQVNGGGQVVLEPFSASIANGAIVGTLSVPNSCMSLPQVGYLVEIISGGKTIRSDLIGGCIVTGSTWSYDSFVPTTTNVQTGQSVTALAVQHMTISQDCTGPGCSPASVSYSWNIQQPTTADSGIWQHYFPVSRNVVQVTCDTDAQSTATINFEIRQQSTPNTSGTLLLPSPLSCGATVDCATGTGCTSTFTSTSIPANSLLAPVVDSVSAVMLRVHLTLQP